MPKTSTGRYVRPIEAAAFDLDGVPVVLNPNLIYEADDEQVRAHPELFKPVEATRQRPDVEQATAAPGELRGE